jgi:hypothetical protein
MSLLSSCKSHNQAKRLKGTADVQNSDRIPANQVLVSIDRAQKRKKTKEEGRENQTRRPDHDMRQTEAPGKSEYYTDHEHGQLGAAFMSEIIGFTN